MPEQNKIPALAKRNIIEEDELMLIDAGLNLLSLSEQGSFYEWSLAWDTLQYIYPFIHKSDGENTKFHKGINIQFSQQNSRENCESAAAKTISCMLKLPEESALNSWAIFEVYLHCHNNKVVFNSIPTWDFT